MGWWYCRACRVQVCHATDLQSIAFDYIRQLRARVSGPVSGEVLSIGSWQQVNPTGGFVWFHAVASGESERIQADGYQGVLVRTHTHVIHNGTMT